MPITRNQRVFLKVPFMIDCLNTIIPTIIRNTMSYYSRIEIHNATKQTERTYPPPLQPPNPQYRTHLTSQKPTNQSINLPEYETQIKLLISEYKTQIKLLISDYKTQTNLRLDCYQEFNNY